ncbi:bestrophin-like domain [Caballeronia glebae]|uniref:bestrophin-like domain n=1 Tax=Caballeronia glebae TaxID=1777143 RepID=UPI0038B961EC
MTSTWLHNLPLWQMTLVVFGATGAAGAAVHFVTGRLAAGAHRRSFTALSPGLLSPIGIIFGLLIAFTAAQVWNDTARANNAVDAEAGALRSVVVLSAVFPEDAQMQLRKLVREYIEYTVGTEWPMMAQGAVTLKISPPTLNEALQFTLALPANTAGQQTAQRQLTVSLEKALEARRERILVSRSEVSGIKWLCLSFLAVCLVFAIALVHGENRLTSALALGLFCASLATTMLLILSHDRPFSGEIAVKPEPLLQVIPAAR